MVYDRNLQNGRGLLRIVGHSDTALDAEGREVFVYQDPPRHTRIRGLVSQALTVSCPEEKSVLFW